MPEYHTEKTFSEQLQKQPPIRLPNKEVRPREHLTPDEVDKLVRAARERGRHGERDALICTMLFKHALRVSEITSLEWDQINLKTGTIRVDHRAKDGTPGVHYLDKDEIKALVKIAPISRYVFTGERNNAPLTERAVHKIVRTAGDAAGLEDLKVHPHMLRHAKGYQLASSGTDTRLIQGYLGHRSITTTVKYTELNPVRFKGLEKTKQ